jgi:tRNA pseudouridine55 synthase
VHDGLVVVDKPAGWTSHDVVGKLRRVYGQRKVGHAGTLDPDATGVLLVGLGRATRLLRFLQEQGKAYRGRVRFGVATTTLDAAGEIVEQRPMPVSAEEVAAAMPRFVGDIEQIPPMVSAVQIGGRRLHELARKGEEVERAPRPVHVDTFVLEAFEPGPYPEATVLVECGSGTYVRTLAADLGTALGGCAHLGSLRRLRVGSFTLDGPPLGTIRRTGACAIAVAMRDLERMRSTRGAAVSHGVRSGALAVSGWPRWWPIPAICCGVRAAWCRLATRWW